MQLAPLGGAYLFNSSYTLRSAAGGATETFGQLDMTGTFGDGVLLTLKPKRLTPIESTDNAPTAPSGLGFIGPTGRGTPAPSAGPSTRPWRLG